MRAIVSANSKMRLSCVTMITARSPSIAIERSNSKIDMTGFVVERRRRFVAHQQLRPMNQCAGDRHALLLAAGKLAGKIVHAVGHAHLRQERSGGRHCLAFRISLDHQRHGRVFGRRERRAAN